MATARPEPAQDFLWTPALIRRFRGKRTLARFAGLLATTKNTVWRWESGRVAPDAAFRARLSRLAERERFSPTWRLAGSLRLRGDIETGSRAISVALRRSVERRARALGE